MEVLSILILVMVLSQYRMRLDTENKTFTQKSLKFQSVEAVKWLSQGAILLEWWGQNGIGL